MEDLLKRMKELYEIESIRHRESRKKEWTCNYVRTCSGLTGVCSRTPTTKEIIKSPKPDKQLPFNLSKALEGYQVVDELGRKVKVVAKLSCESQYPVVVIRTNENGEYVRQYSTEGICKTYGTKLFMVGKQETEFCLITPAGVTAQVVTTLVKN